MTTRASLSTGPEAWTGARRRNNTPRRLASIAAVAIGLGAVHQNPSAAVEATQQGGVVFSEVAAASGIRFIHNSGRAGRKWLPETMGSGCALFDADGDGWLDLLLINGRDWAPSARRSTHALYRNDGTGHFRDVTAGSGLDVQSYGMGVAVGDYDNDGRGDVYITALDGDRLFHNEGGGRFRDVTAAAGIRNKDFGTSAAWLDYDRDGLIDLFVANYVKWTPQTDLHCSLDGSRKSYCTPESYPATRPRLFRNLGAGRFEDASEKAGFAEGSGKSLGVAVLDYDVDGWPDLFVANDTQPNKLYRNTGKGVFVEEGTSAGVAFSEDGQARGAMGTDAGDYDRSGRPHLLVGNFANEMLGLYHNEGSGLFVDEAPRSAVGRDSLLSLTFGAFFFDYDLDGWLDIFAANGHLEEEIENVQPKVKYRQPPLLFRNRGKGMFENVRDRVGADFGRPMVARGAAHGDVDGDGDLDILLTDNDGPARLLRNDGGNRNAWLRVRLVGRRSNSDGLGAQVTVKTPAGKRTAMVKSGSSYCSHSDTALTFGLGPATDVAELEVSWPSGAKQRLGSVKASQLILVDEEKGIVKSVPRVGVALSERKSARGNEP
jgi:enediyne biosynthesis protein E4